MTIVDVYFAVESSKSLRAITSVTGNGISAISSILTRCADTVVNVDVTFLARESGRTDTLVSVNHICADATVDARIRSAFIDVNFAMDSSVTFLGEKNKEECVNGWYG